LRVNVGVVDADDQYDNIMAEWEQHMENFIPADMVTFDIASRTSFAFFEEIMEVPTVVRGAYFVSHTSDSKITF